MNETVGQRIRLARLNKKVSLRALAAEINVSAQAIQQWEHERTQPDDQRIPIIAAALDVNSDWLATGLTGSKDKPSSNAVMIDKNMGRIIPLVDIKNFNYHNVQGVMALARGSGSLIHTYFPCSANSLAVRLTDRSMEPDFRMGEIIVIDPDIPPNPGDFIFFEIKDMGLKLFRRFTYSGEMIKAATSNKDWKELEFSEDQWTSKVHVYGTWSESVRSRQAI